MFQCLGFVKDPKHPLCPRQCKKQYTNGYCHHHINQCRGHKRDGFKCVAKQRPGSLYCRADHDPAKGQFYMDPNLFRLPNLRANNVGELVQLYDHKDAYHHDDLPSACGNSLGLAYQLDHKCELQAAAHAVREAQIEGPEDKEIVIEFLRDNVLNKDPNLCFTRKPTNVIKGAAVTNLLEDLRTDGAIVHTFTDYMQAAAAGNNARLGRSVTKVIRQEVEKATKFCQYKLEDESDTPSFARVNRQFKALRIVMRD